MMGIRSVDPAERAALAQTGITVHDMRDIDERGIVNPLTTFLDRVDAALPRGLAGARDPVVPVTDALRIRSDLADSVAVEQFGGDESSDLARAPHVDAVH